MLHNQLFSEEVGILGHIVPAHATAGAYSTGWVDLSIFAMVGGVVSVGVLGSSATIAAKLEQATSSGGSGIKDVTNKAITGLTQTPTDNSSTTQIINCRADELDIVNGFRYVRLTITVGVATSDVVGLLMGLGCKYGPASDHDDTTVSQYVN